MSKKKSVFSYLFSIFKKDGLLEVDKNYSKFMVNRFLYSIDNAEIRSIIDELNTIQNMNMSNEDHYYILYNAVPKGFYKLPKKLVFTENTNWKKLKVWLVKFGQTEQLSVSDITDIMSFMTEDELEALYNKIEILQKEG